MCGLLSTLHAVIEELLVYSRLTSDMSGLLSILYAVFEVLLVLF